MVCAWETHHGPSLTGGLQHEHRQCQFGRQYPATTSTTPSTSSIDGTDLDDKCIERHPDRGQAVENARTTIAGLASGINTTSIINAMIQADAVPETAAPDESTTAQTHADRSPDPRQ
jgi:hypothetical protein